MRKNLKILLMVGLVLGLFFSNSVIVTAAELSGREIMDKVYNREEGNDRNSNLKMVLVNKAGDKRIREIKQYEKDFGQVEKKIMFFVSPRDVRGTSFMNWSYDDDRADNQWIYLPALRKVKRISAENKSDYFMGSDFTYDDLGDRTIDEDKHSLLKTEEVDGQTCYVVESIPVAEDYMYSRTVSWVVKDKWIGLKKEFYDPEGKLLKTLTVKDYRVIDGIITILKSEMHNVQTGHKTILETGNVEYNTGIEAELFTERMMRRGL